ncbi:hypothetical protein M2447_000812 [Ereboglobus sp. PH5-10]|nr:hypothetical protein [Ereboglobus sp. PH5-10]
MGLIHTMKKIILALFVFPVVFAALTFAQTPRELVAMLPKIDGWTISKQVEVFTGDNLFDRINGAAEGYLKCNFAEMTSVDYTKDGTDKYVTLQMYRHATPFDAFAIYSAERSPGPAFLQIGAEGYRAAGLVHFLSGSMYVKVTTSDESPETPVMMEKVARTLAAKIDPAAALPAILKAFPRKNKRALSETYIVDSFLGHKFMLPAWSATYDKNGKDYAMFIIDGKTKAGIEKLLGDYAKFNRQKSAPQEGAFVMPDRFNGDIPMLWRGQYIFGITNDSGADIDASALLARLAEAVK